MMRTLISTLIYFVFVCCQAQADYKIRVHYRSMADQYELELFTKDSTVQVILAEISNETAPLSEKDSLLMANILKRHRKLKITDTDIRIVPALYRKYNLFKKDSMTLAADHSVALLAHRLVLASKAELEGGVRNKNRVVIDGSSVKLEIYSNNTYRAVYAHAPSQNSHPLIHGLIKGILETYRINDPKILLKPPLSPGPEIDYSGQIRGRNPNVKIIKD